MPISIISINKKLKEYMLSKGFVAIANDTFIIEYIVLFRFSNSFSLLLK